MPNNNPLNILHNLKKLSLTSQEKQAMRSRLIMAIQATRSPKKSVLVAFASLIARPLAAALVIVLVISGGTAFAAEGTLPGDLLYPLKINFNEEVTSAVLSRVGGNAYWQITRAERRLEEAEQLP